MSLKVSINARIFAGIITGVGRTGAMMFSSIVLLRLACQNLPRELVGIWLLFLSFAAYFAFCDLGISPTLSREVGIIRGAFREKPSELSEEIARAVSASNMLFRFAAILVLFVGVGGGGVYFSNLTPPEYREEVMIAWLIFVIGASFNLLTSSIFATLYGLGDVATERIIRTVGPLVGLVLYSLSTFTGLGILGFSLAWVGQSLLERFLGWLALRRHRLRGATAPISWVYIRRIVVPSAQWAVMGIGALFILQTDLVIIAQFLGVTHIPSYEAAMKIVVALMSLALLVVTSSTPYISEAFGLNDISIVRSIVLRNVRLGLGIMVLLVAYVAVNADLLIFQWLGPGVFAGRMLFVVLLVTLTLEVHHVVLASGAMATGHLVFHKPAVLAGVLKILISILLVPHLGVLGVAMGTLVAQLLTNNWYAPYVTLRLFHIPLGLYVRETLMPVVLVAGAALVMNVFVRHILAGQGSHIHDPFFLVQVTLVSGALSCVAFGLFLVSPEEKVRIKETLHAICKRSKKC